MRRLTMRERIFGSVESRYLPAPENELPLMASYTNSTISTSDALAIGDVWAAVRVLADAASSLPLHVFKKGETSRVRVTSGFLVDLLEKPGPTMTQADLVSSMMAHLAIYGNAYVAKYRSAGEVIQLGLLDPERVRPELYGGEVRFRYSSGPQRMLTTSDVVHVRGLSTDGLTGLSAVTQASRVLGLSDELVKHALAFFDTGSIRPAGILRLHPDAHSDAQSRWREKLTNEGKPHGLLVLEGDASYDSISAPMDDSQFVEQRRLAAQEIARVFRIPPHMLGAPTGDSLTYSTVEQQSLDFVRYSLQPWLRRIELAISGDRDLTFLNQYVKFELDGLLRADAATRSEVYSRALDPITGWMTRAEVRELEDLPPEAPRAAEPPETSIEAMVATATTNGSEDQNARQG